MCVCKIKHREDISGGFNTRLNTENLACYSPRIGTEENMPNVKHIQVVVLLFPPLEYIYNGDWKKKS